MSIQQKLTPSNRTQTPTGDLKDRLNISTSDIETLSGLSCHNGTCHIARSEFEVTSPVTGSETARTL